MKREKLKRKIMLSSIPLRKLDASDHLIGTGSGCIVDFNNSHYLLTVRHVVEDEQKKDKEKWAIEKEVYYENQKTKLIPIGDMSLLYHEGSLDLDKNPDEMTEEEKKKSIDDLMDILNGKEGKEIDYAYKRIQPISIDTPSFDPEKECYINEKKIILESNLNNEPLDDLRYGFYGMTRPSKNGNKVEQDARLVMGMKFSGTTRNLWQFNIQGEYQSHKDYQGCSGAPILDSNGELVSLVAEGDMEDNAILGVKLSRYRSTLEIG